MALRRSSVVASLVFVGVLLQAALTLAGYDALGDDSVSRKVLVIGCDGTRGDVLHNAMFNLNMAPNFRALAESGKYTTCESSDDPNCARAHSGHLTNDDFIWCTAPGWGSVLTGVDNDKTLVRGNDELQQAEFHYTTMSFPTFMSLAKSHGYRTAASGAPNFISSWKEDKSDDIGIIDYECPMANRTHVGFPVTATSSCNLDFRAGQSGADPDRDRKTTAFGVERIKNDDADVIMLHFDLIDHMGHQYNFSSNPGYLKAIAGVDAQIGELLSALKESGNVAAGETRPEWLVMLTSDHGGHHTSHNTDSINDTAVPFMVSTMHSGVAMTDLRTSVRHFDVNPTVAWWLGIDQSSYDLDGRVQGFDENTKQMPTKAHTLRGAGTTRIVE